MPRKTPPSKAPYQFTEFDRQVLQATAEDLTGFSEWFFAPSGSAKGPTPIPWQHYFYHKPQKRKTLIAGIRSGKTYAISLGFPHYSLFNAHSRIANASISADQAKIVFYNVLDLVSRPRFERFVKDSRKHPFPVIELINGSEMWFRSVGYEAELWRGWEFDWINIDEAAYVTTKTTIDTLDGRLLGLNTQTNRPRAGLRTITTSPKGRGWLMEEYNKGDKGRDEYNPERFLSMRVRSIDNPNLDRKELEALFNDYSERQRKQELLGLFLDPEDAVFGWEAIQWTHAMERPEVRELMDKIDELSENPGPDGYAPKVLDKTDYARYELPPGHNKSYLISWDLGTSATRHLGRNATVGMVFDLSQKPWRLVAYRRETKASYSLIIRWVKEWHLRYNNFGLNGVETVIDATGSGNPVQQILQEEHGLDIDGIIYGTASKPDIINAGAVMLEQGNFVMPPIRAVVDELSGYEIDDKKIVQDTVMALCQGLHRARARFGDMTRNTSGLILPTRTGQNRREAYDQASERYDARRRAARSVRTSRNYR